MPAHFEGSRTELYLLIIPLRRIDHRSLIGARDLTSAAVRTG